MSDRFAESDAEAASRFKKYRSLDPFPSISPALLSSREIQDYVAATGMLHPFDPEDVKPASYEVAFEGRVVYWDGEGKRFDKEIQSEGDTREFTLYKNSIAFVQVRPRFRLPAYIAIRFNLKITHVYRGLLLGTGPLVDPGYEGHLYIPLHNLTNNNYVFTAGEGLLWMEFTKLAWDQHAKGAKVERVGEYKEFPDRKKNKPLEYFFKKANQSKPIPSSIPVEIVTVRQAADEARAAAESAKTSNAWIRNIGVGAFVAFAFGIGGLYYNTWNLVRTTQLDVKSDYKEMQTALESERQRLEELEGDHGKLLGRVEALQQSLAEPTAKEPLRDPATGDRKTGPEG